MRSIYSRGLLLFALLVGVVLLGAAEPRPKDDKRPASDTVKEAKPPPLELPPGTVLGVFDSIAEALRMAPRAVVMTPEQYKTLQDELERLRRLLDKPRPHTPARSHLKGKVEGNLVHLSVEFEFETREDNALVRLACGQGLATAVSLDGRTPRLKTATTRAIGKERPEDASESDGFVVEIDRPGRHLLTLELLLALTSTPNGQGFTLDLPRTAVTRLDLDLPPGARDVRLGGKPVADALLDLKNNQLSGNLGAADRLDLTWKPAHAATTSATLTADGVVKVLIEDKQMTTDARLTLRVQSGQVRQWQLLVPHKSRLKVEPPAGGDGSQAAEGPRVDRIETADKKLVTLYTIHLKEATSDPLTVTIDHTQPSPDPKLRKAVSVGPFTVLGAVRHQGSVLVSNTMPDWHLEITPHGDVSRREAEEEARRDVKLVAAFRYGPGNERRQSLSWLDIEVDLIRNLIKAQPKHEITLGREEGRPCWKVRSTFTVTPRRPEVGPFRVLLPEGCELNAAGCVPEPKTSDLSTRTVEFPLGTASTGPIQPVTIVVEANCVGVSIDEKTPGQGSLSLPRSADAFEQNGIISVVAPPNLEVLPPEVPAAVPGLELIRQTTHELSWCYPHRTPARIELAWRPYRPPVSVSSLADVILLPGEVRIHQELRFAGAGFRPVPGKQDPADPQAGRVLLRVPATIPALAVKTGGVLLSWTPAALDGSRIATVAVSSDRNPTLLLDYHYPLPEGRDGADPEAKGAPLVLPLPLVVPEQITSGETRARIWAEAGQLPTAAAGWTEQNIEVVPDRPRLPVLVLRSDRVDRPLILQMGKGEPILPALIERALVRVVIGPDGRQDYRVSYRLARLANRRLDLELPGPHVALNFQARLDGKLINHEALPAEPRQVGLRLAPDLVKRPTVLDVSYQLEAGRMSRTAVTTPLLAPHLVGESVRIPTRWQISVPPSWVLLAPQAGPGSARHWARRGWLLAPHNAVTSADLEHWFVGDSSFGQDTATPPGAEPPSLTLWEDQGELQLWHVQQQPWLLFCSLGLVLLGLAVSRVPLVTAEGQSSGWAWFLLLGLLLAVGVLVILVPGLAGQLAYGCQPGAAVLLILVGIQWLLHERYRRQIVFLPSFSRSRSGSSLLRHEQPPAEHPAQPSTIDVPHTDGRGAEEEPEPGGHPSVRGPAGSST